MHGIGRAWGVQNRYSPLLQLRWHDGLLRRQQSRKG
jgi:hypothetical protein